MIHRLSSILLAAVVLLAGTPSGAVASHVIPTSQVIQTGLVIPWDIAFAPDGTMFVTERPGRIRAYASGTPGAALLSTTTIPSVRAEHEAGANGLAIDVAFDTHPFLYVCAARDADGAGGAAPWRNEVLRYRVTPERTLVEPTVLFDAALAHTQHNGCSVEMDASGHLWVGIGDAGNRDLAQDPDSPNGKILRMTRDGAVPVDNPTLPGAAARTVVYSMGHRNPQGIAFQPGTGQPYAAEHGPSVNDEVNRIVPGANYGWPCYTGASTPYVTTGCGPASSYTAPAWSSGGATIATSGMTFLDHPGWESWNGSAMVAQLKEQDLRRFTVSGDGTTLDQVEIHFDGTHGRLRAAVQAPDGSLFLTTSNGGADKVVRVVPGDVIVDRFFGNDRYATAADIALKTFAPGVPVVYVATGSNYPDALAGGAAAARDGGPVLLVTRDGIPAATRSAIEHLDPFRIEVLGGAGVVSQAVQDQLHLMAPGGAHRLAGANRYETAAVIARTFSIPVGTAYVATGTDYPDALAGVPAAGLSDGPILLVTPTGIPAATAERLDRLDPQRIVVLGGNGAVSPSVANQLQQYTPSGVLRYWGADRYATAVDISLRSFPDGASRVFIATGRNFPDGLTGGAAAAHAGGPLLLVPGTSLPQVVRDELVRLHPDRVTILGGPGVVSEAVRLEIEALLNP